VESFATYVPFGPGAIRKEYSSKYFDDLGNPISLSKGWLIGRKAAPFALSVKNETAKSFREFLISQGLENLVP
jgi:hypothetical protein